MSAQRRQPKRRAVKRRNPAYTTREIEPGKWGIIGPDGPTHKWFTSKARAEAWIDTNAGAEVKKWTGGGSQERFDFRGKAPDASASRDRTAHTPDDAAASKRAEAAERVKREAAEQAERIRARHAAEAADRAAEREEAKRAERAAEQARAEAEERQRERAAWNEKMAEARRAAEERGRQAQAEREAREAHMRSEAARAEAEREAREAYERFQARERAAKEQQERERAESDERRARASKEQANKQRTAREGKAKSSAGKAPKVEWVHVGVNTWAGFETVGGTERALFTGVQKDSNNWFTKRRGQTPGYRVIGTAPLDGYGVHARLKAVNLRMDVGKNYGSFPTLEDARKAAIAEDRRLQGDSGFHQDRASAEHDAAERQRAEAEREAARARARAERDASENQRAAARIASGPWTTSANLTWTVTTSTYGASAHAIGPDGKALFAFAWRRNNAPVWEIYTVKGDLVARSRDSGVPQMECAVQSASHLRRFAAYQEPWPPRQTPRWQDVRDRLEAGYKRQEDDARRSGGGSRDWDGRAGRSYTPPPSGLHGFKRYADLSRMAAPGSGGSDNERALAARLMAKMQAEWDAANGTDREGLRAKWHRNPARTNPARTNPARTNPTPRRGTKRGRGKR